MDATTPFDPPVNGSFAEPPAAGGLSVERLREALKRCSPATCEAALRFYQTGSPEHLPAVVDGIVERYVEPALRPRMEGPRPDLRLAEDLGLDSLTLMEIVMLAEEVLQISITNDELIRLRTLGEVRLFVERKVRGAPVPDPVTRCAETVAP
jgi:acyl carrier protein